MGFWQVIFGRGWRGFARINADKAKMFDELVVIGSNANG
jgi:hypothetical protein